MEQENVKCVRCESFNTRTFFRQIRNNDEIANECHRCLDCQYGWKSSFRSPSE